MSERREKAKRDAQGEPRTPQQTMAEWTVFGLAGLLLSLVIAILLIGWLQGRPQPPMFETRALAVRAVPAGFQLPVNVENLGSQAAADVLVAAELTRHERMLEQAEQTISFMAPGERVKVTFVFARDPRQGEVSVRVVGYQEP